MKKVLLLLTSIFIFIVFACTEDDLGSQNSSDDYNRAELANSWVNNMLLPAITDLNIKLESLDISAIAFVELSNQENLEQLREDWLSAYKVWQHVHLFVEGSDLSQDMNTYPVDLNQLEDNINVVDNNTISITFTRHNDVQGFPTIDYLINGVANSDIDIIKVYQDDINYGKYLAFLTDRMVAITDAYTLELQNNSETNINDTGNNKNSYFNKQINDVVQFIEVAFRENKIATPSGARQSQRTQTQIDNNIIYLPTPEAVEARYSSENSKDLYLEAYKAIQNLYLGRTYSDGSDTVGIQDYLQFLGTTILLEGDSDDILLDEYIITLFNNIDASNNNITDNFYEQTQDYNTNFDQLFTNIQELVVALKGNALDAFNIDIDFADNDGD